jgi:hypothetical protein
VSYWNSWFFDGDVEAYATEITDVDGNGSGAGGGNGVVFTPMEA